jgi:copper chaperone CopZ
VKKPARWRHSSRYKALSQMLLTNQWLKKLAASRADFTRRDMLGKSFISVYLYTAKSVEQMHANICAAEDSAQVSKVEAEQMKRNEKKARKNEEAMRKAAEEKRKPLQLEAELQVQEVRVILKVRVNT